MTSHIIVPKEETYLLQKQSQMIEILNQKIQAYEKFIKELNLQESQKKMLEDTLQEPVYQVGEQIQAFMNEPRYGSIIDIDTSGPVPKYLVKFNSLTYHSARWMTKHCILSENLDVGSMDKMAGY